MKKILLICSLVVCAKVGASSLYSPYPSVLSSNIEVGFLYPLAHSKSADFRYYGSGSVNVSTYPLLAVPSIKIDTGLELSLGSQKSSFVFQLSTGLGVIINPFLYRDKFFDVDILILNSNRINVGYEIATKGKWMLEPYIGGSIDLFLSMSEGTGIMPWFSLNAGLKIQYKAER